MVPDYANFYYSLGAAQYEYAESIVNSEAENKENEAENKAKATELKESAISNLEKYLELSPNAEDKDDVEELIKSCQKEETPEKQVVLEG